MHDDPNQVSAMRNVILLFSAVSGLKIIFSRKSALFPVGKTNHHSLAANILQCKLDIYLGYPLGVQRLDKQGKTRLAGWKNPIPQ